MGPSIDFACGLAIPARNSDFKIEVAEYNNWHSGIPTYAVIISLGSLKNAVVVNAESKVSLSSRILPWAIAFGLLSAVLAIAAKNMIVDLDLFHEMALYRQMETEGQMPTTDAFAYTPTIEPVVHHEWATGAVLYLATVKSGWGADGLVAIKYFLTFAVCIGCFIYSRRQGASVAVFAVLAPFALNLGGWMAFNNIRAQLFTLFFLVLLFFLLDQDRKGKRWWIAAWLPMFVVWANMHGGVVSGMGILGVYCFARLIEAWIETKSVGQTLKRVWHLIAVGVATLLLLNLNPYGWDYTPYLVRAVLLQRPLIMEWQPIWEIRLPIIYGVSVLIAAYGIGCRGKESLFETFALLLTAYLAAKHYRHGSLYAVTWACFVPPMIHSSHIGDTIEDLFKKYRPQIAMIGVAIGLVAVGFAINMKFWKLQVPTDNTYSNANDVIYPAGAVDYLREQAFVGNLFVPFSIGAFVEWKLYPEVKVSLDSRYEVAYPKGALEENNEFYNATDSWKATLTKYDTHAILVPQARRLAEQLEKDDGELADAIGWKCVYRDKGHSIYVPTHLAGRFPFVDRSHETIVGVYP